MEQIFGSYMTSLRYNNGPDDAHLQPKKALIPLRRLALSIPIHSRIEACPIHLHETQGRHVYMAYFLLQFNVRNFMFDMLALFR